MYVCMYTYIQVGDVLGVLIDLGSSGGADSSSSSSAKKKGGKASSSSGGGGVVTYFLNGKSLGSAFTNLPLSASPPADR